MSAAARAFPGSSLGAPFLRMVHGIYLSSEPQPALSDVHEGEFAHRVGNRVSRLDILVRPRSEFIAGHSPPSLMMMAKNNTMLRG
jgi:hypothetical protein